MKKKKIQTSGTEVHAAFSVHRWIVQRDLMEKWWKLNEIFSCMLSTSDIVLISRENEHRGVFCSLLLAERAAGDYYQENGKTRTIRLQTRRRSKIFHVSAARKHALWIPRATTPGLIVCNIHDVTYVSLPKSGRAVLVRVCIRSLLWLKFYEKFYQRSRFWYLLIHR